MRKLVIFGTGPLAQVMATNFLSQDDFEVVAFTADRRFLTLDSLLDKPVVAFEDISADYPPSEVAMFCSVGYTRMRDRARIFGLIDSLGYEMPNFISPQAFVDGTVKLGRNNALLGSVSLEPFSTVGDNNLLYAQTTLGHHSVLGSHNCLAGGTLIAGRCRIGDLCFFGVRAATVGDLEIADETYLGPGSLLFTSTEVATKYAGNPARGYGRHAEAGIEI